MILEVKYIVSYSTILVLKIKEIVFYKKTKGLSKAKLEKKNKIKHVRQSIRAIINKYKR